MSNAILHISDLHFVLDKEERKSKTRFDENFQKIFIDALIKIKNDTIKYLVVTGDIADTSADKEYSKALTFLNKIANELEIEKKNIIICPGNHDISWTELAKIAENEDIEDSQLYTKQKEKFAHFTKFYSDFFKGIKPSFDVNSAIFDKIIDHDDRIVILAVNTCFRESNQDKDHIGFINKSSFETELNNIDFQNQYKDYGKILAMHHNPKDLSSEKKHNLENWKELPKDNIGLPFIVLCGHIHGQDGEATQRNDGSIAYISTGSLTKNTTENTFNIYYDIGESKINIDYYALQSKDNLAKSFWQSLTNINQQLKTADFRPNLNESTLKLDEVDILLNEVDEGMKQDINRELQKPKKHQTTKHLNKITNRNIIDFIKERNLFKSGHFHWKNEFRSHGFIDINNLVSRKDSLEVITKLFYNEICKKFNNKFQDTIIIAVGIECNIIGARLSILLDCGYSYIPEPSKEKDFSEIEKAIKSENYKKIILLKDIVYNAEHSKELLTAINTDNKEIFVFSLFYCGKKEMKESIFSNYNNVIFVSICDDIAINQCDYSGKGCLDKCPIYKNKLETIYDEC